MQKIIVLIAASLIVRNSNCQVPYTTNFSNESNNIQYRNINVQTNPTNKTQQRGRTITVNDSQSNRKQNNVDQMALVKMVQRSIPKPVVNQGSNRQQVTNTNNTRNINRVQVARTNNSMARVNPGPQNGNRNLNGNPVRSNLTNINDANTDDLITLDNQVLIQQNNNPVNRVQQQRNSNPVDLSNGNNGTNEPEIQVRLINIQVAEKNTDIQVNEINVELNLPELPKVEIPAFTASLDLDLNITKPEITLPQLVMPEINLPKINLPERDKKEKTERKTKHSGYSQKGRNYTGKKIRIWFQKNFKIVHKIRLSVSCPKF